MLEVEKAAHSSSTPSSEDVGAGALAEQQLNVSIDSGDYEVPKPERRRARTTVSGVRADAARVLERFLQKTEELRISSVIHDSSDIEGEHQYAVVADQYEPPDQMPTPYQPMGSEESLYCKSSALMTTSAFDTLPPVESDYVDCQMVLAGQGKLSSTHSFHTLGLLTRSPCAKDLVQHPPKVKSKPKRLTALETTSSSSTEDYEYTDNELLNRKKKSFFRWATERIESIRSKGKKSTVVTTVKRPDFSLKSDVPLPPPPTAASSCTGLHRNGSEKSKSNSSSTPNETTEQLPVHRGAELETLAEEHQTHKKSVVVWKKSDAGKDKKKDGSGSVAEEKVKDSRGVFDGLLRQFRRGSAKLKGKGSRAKHRSCSADRCTIRRPTQEAMKLVERLADVNAREPPSEYDSDVAAVRLSVATSQMADFDPVTPPLPMKLLVKPKASGSQRASRAKMNLNGLIACRPQMPTPRCGSALSTTLADATDGIHGLPDLEQALALKSSKPFCDKSQCEKEELYERIAEQLAAIADRLNLESPRSLRSSNPSGPEDEKATETCGTATGPNEERPDLQLDTLIPRPTGDLSSSSMQPLEVVAGPIVAELVQNARNSNVSRFQQLVSDNVGSDTGWLAIARMFRLTQSAVQMAGMGTAIARQIKEMTLNYFEDRFANWIVDQGGWESMVEETNTELDSELD